MGVHAVDMGVVDDAVQVEHEGAEGGVVGVGQAVDDGVEVVTADDFVFVFYSWSVGAREQGECREMVHHTRCVNEAAVVLRGKQRIRQIPEELLQQARNTVDIVEEVLWVSKIKCLCLRFCVRENILLVGKKPS